MSRILSIIAIVLLFASCNNNSYKNQSKEKGVRIVSLAPSLTKELVSLDLKNNIVGATSYCDISASNKDLIVGSATTVNIEKILLLKPDIVLASGLTKENTITALKDNGIEVHKFGRMKSFNDICNHFLELGKLVGKEKLAKLLIDKSIIKVDSLKALVPEHADSLKVFFQIGAKPIFTVTPNMFMNDYITFSGCKNLANDLSNGAITRETVINRNPDVIFVVTMGIVGDNEKRTWESYTDLSATKNNRIFIIDSSVASTPTVLSFTKTLEVIIKNLYQN